MNLPVVVGVDGSPDALTAVEWAADEAARHGLPLRLLYASLWERYEGDRSPEEPGPASEQVMADTVVATAADHARRRAPGLKVLTDIVPEEAVQALLYAGHNATLLVTGSRGRGGLRGLLLGSVGLAVAGRAHCPVVVVRGDRAALAGTHERILLGAGDPDSCEEAVRFAFGEARARGCVLDVVRAWRRPLHDPAGHPLLIGDPAHEQELQASEQLDAVLREAAEDHPEIRLRRATAEGPARRVLLDRSAAADLVIVGARRRTGLVGLQLGRVAHTLLHHAPCPVAIVPQRV
ncbi:MULTISPECIES: universal stress protein [unclassified Streptomyces]|uniref:universal stress protein n=1 Tax=unclassified Streptomyces TaxID=2593676 RepID=UPI003D71F1A7